MIACLEFDLNGGGLSGKRSRAATSTASPTFRLPSVSERPAVRSGGTSVALDGRPAREQAWQATRRVTASKVLPSDTWDMWWEQWSEGEGAVLWFTVPLTQCWQQIASGAPSAAMSSTTRTNWDARLSLSPPSD